MTYDQQKRESIANAKHLVELLEEISDEHPGTTQDDRRSLYTIGLALNEARCQSLAILHRENNP